MNPPLVVRGETACRDHAVHMWMQEQVLTPGVRDADETNLALPVVWGSPPGVLVLGESSMILSDALAPRLSA